MDSVANERIQTTTEQDEHDQQHQADHFSGYHGGGAAHGGGVQHYGTGPAGAGAAGSPGRRRA